MRLRAERLQLVWGFTDRAEETRNCDVGGDVPNLNENVTGTEFVEDLTTDAVVNGFPGRVAEMK